jgi:hypothetical protein
MENDEDGGTPMPCNRYTAQKNQPSPTNDLLSQPRTTQAKKGKQINQRADAKNMMTSTNEDNQSGPPTNTNNQPNALVQKDKKPTRTHTATPGGYHAMTTVTFMMTTHPMNAIDGSKRWKHPMEAIDGKTLNNDRTADDSGKWTGGQRPTGWINVSEALHCKARREGSKQWEQALEARKILRQHVVRRHAVSPLSANRR